METTDKQFYVAFSWVLLALIGLTVIVAVTANVMAGSGVEEKNQARAEKVKARIQPIGQVNLASAPNLALETVAVDSPTQQSQQSTAALPPEEVGKSIYEATCQACHSTGVAGAPKVGDKEAWKPRIAAGIASLYHFALNGKGAIMPPKGGNPALKEDEVKAAVDYMVAASR